MTTVSDVLSTNNPLVVAHPVQRIENRFVGNVGLFDANAVLREIVTRVQSPLLELRRCLRNIFFALRRQTRRSSALEKIMRVDLECSACAPIF